MAEMFDAYAAAAALPVEEINDPAEDTAMPEVIDNTPMPQVIDNTPVPEYGGYYDDEDFSPVVVTVFDEDEEEDDYYEEVAPIPSIKLSAAQEASRSKRIADKKRSWIAAVVILVLIAAFIYAVASFLSAHNISLVRNYG